MVNALTASLLEVQVTNGSTLYLQDKHKKGENPGWDVLADSKSSRYFEHLHVNKLAISANDFLPIDE